MSELYETVSYPNSNTEPCTDRPCSMREEYTSLKHRICEVYSARLRQKGEKWVHNLRSRIIEEGKSPDRRIHCYCRRCLQQCQPVQTTWKTHVLQAWNQLYTRLPTTCKPQTPSTLHQHPHEVNWARWTRFLLLMAFKTTKYSSTITHPKQAPASRPAASSSITSISLCKPRSFIVSARKLHSDRNISQISLLTTKT